MRRWRLLHLLLMVVCLLLAVRYLSSDGASFATAPDVPWARPLAMAVNNSGPADATNFLPYNCTTLTYRLADDLTKTMHSGCFVPAAFGLIDPEQAVAIFNGTDEAEPIKSDGKQPGLSILPYSGAVATLGGFPGQGSYYYLYTDFASALKPAGNSLSGHYRELSQAPNFVLDGSDGLPLAVNPAALGYASRSQWMVTEVPGHSLVRINLATFSILPFADSFFTPGRPFATHSARLTISDDGRYAAVASDEFGTLRVYDLKTCGVVDTTDPLAPEKCSYHDYRNYFDNQITGDNGRIIRLSFVTDSLLSVDVISSSGTETYLLTPEGSISSLIPYLGIGDSFASGEGSFDYLQGTDTVNNRCHLSVHSYPLLLSGDLFSSQGHSVACSGAVTHDIGSQSLQYSGQTKDQTSSVVHQADGSEVNILHDYTPGNLAQQRFVTTYQPGVITVQIGGNDVGFSDILVGCLSPLATVKPPRPNPNSCYQSYEDRLELTQTINRQYKNWVTLYKQLRSQSPNSRIYVIGYPQILSSRADCRANVHLTLAELTFARQVTLYLNSVLQQATKAAGVQFIDISGALEGHELCSGSPGMLAVNGLTAGNDDYGLGRETFHPTAYGQELIEQAILSATHNFASQPTAAPQPASTPEAPSDEPLLQAPKSDRPIKIVVPSRTLVGGQTSHGALINITATGMQPDSSFTVTIGGSVAGTVHSDDQGGAQGTVTTPVGAGNGVQPVELTGPGAGGDPTTVTQPIYVTVTPGDNDGDGLPNGDDSCPNIVNSGLDSDNDGIDDACDDGVSPPAVILPPAAPEPLPAADTTLPVVQSLQPAPPSANGTAASPLPEALGADATSVLAAPANELRLSLTTQPAAVGHLAVVDPPLAHGLIALKPVAQRQNLGVGIAHPSPIVATALPALRLRPLLPRFLWYIWVIAVLLLFGFSRLCWWRSRH